MDEILKAISSRVQNEFTQSKVLFHARIEVSNHLAKKNGRPIHLNRRTGGRFLGKSNRLQQAEDFLVSALHGRARGCGLSGPLRCDLWAMFTFYFANYYTTPRKKSETPRRRYDLPDLSNLYELPQDALTKSGVIWDDCLIQSHDLSRMVPGPKNEIEIFLLPFDQSLNVSRPIQPKTLQSNLRPPLPR